MMARWYVVYMLRLVKDKKNWSDLSFAANVTRTGIFQEAAATFPGAAIEWRKKKCSIRRRSRDPLDLLRSCVRKKCGQCGKNQLLLLCLHHYYHLRHHPRNTMVKTHENTHPSSLHAPLQTTKCSMRSCTLISPEQARSHPGRISIQRDTVDLGKNVWRLT